MSVVRWKRGEKGPVACRPGKISVPAREHASWVCWEHGNPVLSEKDTAPGERRGVILLWIAPCPICEEARRRRTEILREVAAAIPGAWIDGEVVRWKVPWGSRGEEVISFAPWENESAEEAVRRALLLDGEVRRMAQEEEERAARIRQESIALLNAARQAGLPPEPVLPPVPGPIPRPPQRYLPVRVRVERKLALNVPWRGEIELFLDLEEGAVCRKIETVHIVPSLDEMRERVEVVAHYKQIYPADESSLQSDDDRLARMAVEQNIRFLERMLAEHAGAYRDALEEYLRESEALRRAWSEYNEAKRAWQAWWEGLNRAQRIAYRIRKNECDAHGVRGDVCWEDGIPSVRQWDAHVPLALL